MRVLTCGAALVILAELLVVGQFASQMAYVRHGWHSRWPYRFDQNRYMDYLLHYRDAALSGGLRGVRDALRARPLYAPTLLATSLPFVLGGEGVAGAYWHLLIYWFLLDGAAILLVLRLTRSGRLAAAAVLAMHLGTQEWFGGSSLLYSAKGMRYEVNVPFAACYVACLALMVEVAYTRAVKTVSVALGLAIAGGVLVRSGTGPVLAVAVVPLVVLSVAAFCHGRKGLGLMVSSALVFAAVVSCAHFARIGAGLAAYARAAALSTEGVNRWSTGTGWARIWWYMCNAERSAVVFAPAMAFSILVAWHRLPRLLGYAKRLGRLSWEEFRSLYVHGVLAWFLIVCYGVPTLAGNGSLVFKMAFVLVTILAGVLALGVVLRSLQGTQLFGNAWAHLPAVALATLCTLMVAREGYGAWLACRAVRGQEEPAAPMVRRKACLAVCEYLAEWCQRQGRGHVSWGMPRVVDFPNEYTVRNWQRLFGKKPFLASSHVLPCSEGSLPAGAWSGPEVAFLPVCSDPALLAPIEKVGGAKRRYRQVQKVLLARGYRPDRMLPVVEGLQWQVYLSPTLDESFRGYCFP